MNWYKNTTEELLHTLQTTRQGLSSEERNQRLAKQGENKITEAAQIPTWKKVGKHFTDLLMLVLIVAAVLKGISGDYIESGIIMAVVVINGFVGYWQERKAQESLDGLKQQFMFMAARRKLLFLP